MAFSKKYYQAEKALPVILSVVLDMSTYQNWEQKKNEIQRQMRVVLRDQGVDMADDAINALINKYVAGRL